VFGVYLCGALFASGWWIFIDGLALIQSASNRSDETQPIFGDWIPGIGSSFSLLMVNIISRSMLSGDVYYGYADDSGVTWKARLWFFIALALGMSSLGGSIGMLAIRFSLETGGQRDQFSLYGSKIVAQNVLIFLSSLIMWVVRNWSSDGSISI
jgi:hypothetical protein